MSAPQLFEISTLSGEPARELGLGVPLSMTTAAPLGQSVEPSKQASTKVAMSWGSPPEPTITGLFSPQMSLNLVSSGTAHALSVSRTKRNFAGQAASSNESAETGIWAAHCPA